MKHSRAAYLITSVLAMFNVLFLPVYRAPEWAMAETGTTLGFYNAAYMLFHYVNPLDYWNVSFMLAIFLPCVALFVSAMIGRQIPFLISSLVGITLWAVIVWMYAHQYGFQSLFALNSGGIGVGVWIALALLLAAMVFGIVGRDDKS